MRLLRVTSRSGHVEYILPESLGSYCSSCWQPFRQEEVDRCGYGTGAGWHPGRCGEETPCWRHHDLVCRKCGAPATEACSFAGASFVCGEPLCKEHEGWCPRH